MNLTPKKKWKWITFDESDAPLVLWSKKPKTCRHECNNIFFLNDGMEGINWIEVIGFDHDLKLGELRRINK